MRMLALALLGGLLAGAPAVAQMGEMKMPEAKPGETISPAHALEEPLRLLEGEMMGVVKAMPADKYSFAPSASSFASGSSARYDGVRTFAGEVSHVAQANYYFYMTLSGLKPDVDLKAIGSMTDKAQLVDVLQKSFDFARKAVATITLENAFVAIKPIDGQNTRASLAAFGVAHGYDHYGQMAEYLRMNGVIPPGSK